MRQEIALKGVRSFGTGAPFDGTENEEMEETVDEDVDADSVCDISVAAAATTAVLDSCIVASLFFECIFVHMAAISHISSIIRGGNTGLNNSVSDASSNEFVY